MPEPFKNLFNEQIIRGTALNFKKQWSGFDQEAFLDAALNNLGVLELKERSNQIKDAMIEYLPEDFEETGKIMLASLGPPLANDLSAGIVDDSGIAGWAVMPMADYVGLKGQNHFDLSMTLLKEMTKRSSSEFGIRFFLLESPEKTLSVLKTWAEDKNHHVRRLVSEGSRPRLPWAMRLPMFITDPTEVIELLEILKDDEEEYVRRSVANNLNDIAKDHPDLVGGIAEKWMKNASQDRKRLIRHACRTLVKQGHKPALQVLGYGPPKIKDVHIEITTPDVDFGGALQFTLSISSDSKEDQSLMIDYAIHHQKANGNLSPKVFKWRSLTLPAQKNLLSNKKHPMRKVTTRVYYPGLHRLEIMINGVSMGNIDFQLLMPQ